MLNDFKKGTSQLPRTLAASTNGRRSPISPRSFDRHENSRVKTTSCLLSHENISHTELALSLSSPMAAGGGGGSREQALFLLAPANNHGDLAVTKCLNYNNIQSLYTLLTILYLHPPSCSSLFLPFNYLEISFCHL